MEDRIMKGKIIRISTRCGRCFFSSEGIIEKFQKTINGDSYYWYKQTTEKTIVEINPESIEYIEYDK